MAECTAPECCPMPALCYPNCPAPCLPPCMLPMQPPMPMMCGQPPEIPPPMVSGPVVLLNQPTIAPDADYGKQNKGFNNMGNPVMGPLEMLMGMGMGMGMGASKDDVSLKPFTGDLMVEMTKAGDNGNNAGNGNGIRKSPQDVNVKKSNEPAAVEDCVDATTRRRQQQRGPLVAQPRGKSCELRGGRYYAGCDCDKRNGLQDDCQRTGCHGSPACLTNPPTCAPSQLGAKHRQEQYERAMKRKLEAEAKKCKIGK